ncbi:D-alanyl-D-alanine carboxypeptidase/D-alanyl-D-alanine-endopeptidase [Psychromonas sp. psych-6C06]|uniref:D-alanyl-D-alanine carboxypeptidase/D-alanyl-D-alanine endopeptidase n=1 Tax=Psychromonas sp. psych-6C06 TaxID=2058089 RepID=UPI000C33BBD3|nr:D-alanyl-D-alanine carboxypeptidase/D-alanyl-D-alanine-endopeptidase [Psychromonas sp. psych-6C06]PKF63017.1 D-alanyl-D-alanine carboxypeptidase/D-alanyl-D-alanine-endopeptidase [Psychromonas sp. psych-6C06]
MLCRYLILFVTLCSSYAVMANEWGALHSLLPKGTQLSYLVVDANKQTRLATYEQETLRTPASMQKLLTATAAKLHLGSEFRYQTELTGDDKKIQHKRYKGDLRLSFVGDPTLTRDDIRQMLRALKKKGVKQIQGDFILNDAHFNGYQWSNGQPWNDLGVCYTAPSHAIVVNKNCVLGNLSLSSNKAKKATLYIPKYEPVSITADVNVVTKEQRETQFCDLEVTRNSQNRYHLLGCMVPRKRAFGLAFAVNDPFAYSSQIILEELDDLDIKLTGDVRLESHAYQGKDKKVLARYESPNLDELLSIMMKESDNLIADSLFKTLGASYFQRPGNFRNGGKALKAILLEQGVDLENAYLADGSGLSRHNLMSAELFMAVLQFVYKNDAQLNLLSSFSIAGVDGTLQYHRALRGKQFKGKVFAKTGSVKGVANLLGVVKTPFGDRLFVLILNGYNKPLEHLKSALPRDENASKYQFERAFFETILSSPNTF